MLARVVQTLPASPRIGTILISADDPAAARPSAGAARRPAAGKCFESAASLSASVAGGVHRQLARPCSSPRPTMRCWSRRWSSSSSPRRCLRRGRGRGPGGCGHDPRRLPRYPAHLPALSRRRLFGRQPVPAAHRRRRARASRSGAAIERDRKAPWRLARALGPLLLRPTCCAPPPWRRPCGWSPGGSASMPRPLCDADGGGGDRRRQAGRPRSGRAHPGTPGAAEHPRDRPAGRHAQQPAEPAQPRRHGGDRGGAGRAARCPARPCSSRAWTCRRCWPSSPPPGLELIVLNSGDGLVHAVLGALFLGQGVRHAAAAGPAAARHDQHDRGRCRARRPRCRPRCSACSMSPSAARSSATSSADACSRSNTIPHRPGERGMFFGAAGIYDGIHLCTGSIHTRGLTGSWASTCTILAILGRGAVARRGGDRDRRRRDRRQRRRRRLDARVRAPLVLATTLDRLVLGTRPFWNVGDAPIHFTHVRPSADRRSSGTPASLLFGGKQRQLPDPPFHSRAAGRVELRLDRPFTIDGEFFRAAPGVPIVITAEEESPLRQAAAVSDRPGPPCGRSSPRSSPPPAPPPVAAVGEAARAAHGAGRLRRAVLRQLPPRRLSSRASWSTSTCSPTTTRRSIASRLMRWLNRLIPPNVYYVESEPSAAQGYGPNTPWSAWAQLRAAGRPGHAQSLFLGQVRAADRAAVGA